MSYITSRLSLITTDDHKWHWERILNEHADTVSTDDAEPWDDPADIVDFGIWSPGYVEIDLVRQLWKGGEQRFYYSMSTHLDENYAIVGISTKPFRDRNMRGDILDRARVELGKFMVVTRYSEDVRDPEEARDRSLGWRLYVTQPGTQYPNLTIQSTYYPIKP